MRLARDLQVRDAAKRRAAAEELSQADERAVYPLIKALRDEDAGVQDAAMRSLISIGGETTAYMVLPLLREDSYLRNTAILILRDIGSAAAPLLYPLLKDKDGDIRKFAIDLLTEIRDGVLPEKICPHLSDPNPNVRASAARSMGLLGYREAVPALIRALSDEEWVCFSVLEALGELQDENAAGAVAGLLSAGPGPLRYAAVEALGKIGSPGSIEALTEHFAKADVLEKSSVVKSLLRLGVAPSMPGVTEELLKMLASDDWDDKITGLRGLSELKVSSAMNAVLDAGGSLDPSEPESEERLLLVRRALMGFGCIDALIAALYDPSVRYRGRVIAVNVIGDLRCREAVPHLLQLLEHDVRDVRRASIEALSDIDGAEVRKVLISAVDDYDSHVRKAAVTALGKIGDKTGFAPIIGLLRGEQYTDVIEEAVRALFAIDRERFLEQLDEFGGPVRDVAGWVEGAA